MEEKELKPITIEAEGEEETIEESSASDTLKANSRSVSDPKSKIEVMKAVIGQVNGMTKTDTLKWFNQAMALIGKEDSALPSRANSGSNQSSIDTTLGKGPKTKDAMPKVSMKEEIISMFSGEELSEEFKEKAESILETAIDVRLSMEVLRLEEEMDNKLQEAIFEHTSVVEKNIETYLDYVAEKWLDENKVEVQKTLKSEIAEEIVDELKNIFVSRNIDIDEDKIDVIEALQEKTELLEQSYNEAILKLTEAESKLIDIEKNKVITSISEGLTVNDSEKFSKLAESLEFDGNLELFEQKLSYIKESYFTNKKNNNQATSTINEEVYNELTEEKASSVDPAVARYAEVISRTVR